MKKGIKTEEAKPAHTPGPWKVGTGWIMSKDNGVICADFPADDQGLAHWARKAVEEFDATKEA